MKGPEKNEPIEVEVKDGRGLCPDCGTVLGGTYKATVWYGVLNRVTVGWVCDGAGMVTDKKLVSVGCPICGFEIPGSKLGMVVVNKVQEVEEE